MARKPCRTSGPRKLWSKEEVEKVKEFIRNHPFMSRFDIVKVLLATSGLSRSKKGIDAKVRKFLSTGPIPLDSHVARTWSPGDPPTYVYKLPETEETFAFTHFEAPPIGPLFDFDII